MNFRGELHIEDIFDLSKIQTGTIADVLDSFGIWGVLDTDIIPLNEMCKNGPTVGYAYTVRWIEIPKAEISMASRPLIWGQIKKLLSCERESAKGKIYIGGVDEGLLRSHAIAGGFSATHFYQCGFRGMVLGGAIQDPPIVENIQMPVWGTNFTRKDSKGSYEIVEIGTSCTVGDLEIFTGDLVVADATDVVVIPQSKIFEVLTLATKVKVSEPTPY
ncbi:MAG: hypothetical protein JKX94_11475 [Sneathiella sp.]|nr:hypothetical protein [Sneathiella sp.]